MVGARGNGNQHQEDCRQAKAGPRRDPVKGICTRHQPSSRMEAPMGISCGGTRHRVHTSFGGRTALGERVDPH